MTQDSDIPKDWLAEEKEPGHDQWELEQERADSNRRLQAKEEEL